MEQELNHLSDIQNIKHEEVTDLAGPQQYDYVYKVITIGDPGKLTNLINYRWW